MSPKLLRSLLLVCLLVAGRDALAVCNKVTCSASTLISDPACCSAGQCDLNGTISLNGPACTLDFGTRAVTLSGTLVVGSATLTLSAGSFRTTMLGCQLPLGGNCGLLDARGTSPNPGGNVTIVTTGPFTMEGTSAGGIDVSGFGSGAGSVTVLAGAGVLLTGGSLDANGSDNNASGGTILINSASGNATIGNGIHADSGINGFAGSFSLEAAGDLTVTDSARITVLGGFGEGEIDLTAAGSVLITGLSVLQANGISGSAADGGSVNITGGSVEMRGNVEAKGGSDPTGDAGGDGGTVSIEATTATLVLMRDTGGIFADAAAGADANEVTLTTDSAVAGDITIAAVISAVGKGGILNRPGGGGSVQVDSARGLTVSKIIDVTGEGTQSGFVDLSAARDITVSAAIKGSDPAGGGTLIVEGGHDITFNGGAATMNGTDSASDAPGGDISLSVANNLLIDAVLSASGAGTGSGGQIDLDSGGNLTIASAVGPRLSANSGGTTGAHGGRIKLVAGATGLTGNLQVDGNLEVKGHSTSTLEPGSIILEGCQVNINGKVGDSQAADADAQSFNLVTGRTGITVNGSLRARGSNTAIFRSTGPPPIVPGTVVPAFTQVTKAVCAGHCSVSDASCVIDNDCPGGQSCVPKPDDCLMPCPTCGDGSRQYPEECDALAAQRCNQACDIHCRKLPPGCSDDNACTTDSCDLVFGCTSTPVADAPPVSCNDGDACTVGDVCQNGICASGAFRECEDHDLCTSDSCDPATGCVFTPMPALCACTGDASCNDGDLCNGTEKCLNDMCEHGTALSCDDNNPCTTDSCDAALGCLHAAVPGCVRCDTGPCPDPFCQTCNSAQRCEAIPGCCTSDEQCDDLEPCTDDHCQGAPSGACVHQTAPNGSAPPGCMEFCGTCSGGVCQPGDCTDPNPDDCTRATCDPTIGSCTAEHDPDCCVGSAAECNDGDACTVDTCNIDLRHCDHDPLKPECRTCSGDLDCDPEGQCAGKACGTDGTCTDVAAPNCEDRRPAFAGHCALDASGQPRCEYECIGCSDGKACNGTETCGNGVCLPGTPLDCDDHDDCTRDHCDDASGCVHDAATGFASVRCRLDTIAVLLQQAADADIKAAVRTKLSSLVGKARLKLEAAERAGTGKRAVKSLKGAGKQVKAIVKAVNAARRKKKIASALADAIVQAATGATRAVDTLKASVAS